jgi:exoribonuclease R
VAAHRVTAPDIDFSALRRELELPGEFPAEVMAEAERSAAAPPQPGTDLTDVAFVTIDPAGARDLDQAMHLSRRGSGFRVRYAIADVAGFVRPGGAIDAEAQRRGQTQYFPDARVPLHPTVLSEGAASLLPGETRPAVVWTIDLDDTGEATAVDVSRALVRSTAQLDYVGVQADLDAGRLPEPLAPLGEIGTLRLARALRRGAIDLNLPDQEVEEAPGGGWKLTFRAPPMAEEYNAHISLLTGECAARIMLEGRIGLLRTLPPADPRDVERLRAAAPALGVEWPDGATPSAVIASVDPSDPRGGAFLDLAAALLRGAAYTPFDGELPAQPLHSAVASAYAHVTAPLRRLADRYTTEICLALNAGREVPEWVRAALAGLPEVMGRSDRRSHEVERAVIDLAEATVLAGRSGEVFDAAVVELNGEGATVVLDDPAVRAKCIGGGFELGTRIRVRLIDADPVSRKVRFERAPE